MEQLSKTNLYITIYNKIEPLIFSFFKKKGVIKSHGNFSQEAILIFVLKYLASLNRGHHILIQSQKVETLEAQLMALTSKFELDEDIKKKMEIVTLNYWINRLKIVRFENSDIYNHISLKLKDEKTYFLNNNYLEGKFSYTLLDDNLYESLTRLFNSLKDNKCIHNDTDIISFYNAFTGKPFKKIRKRIQWIKPKILCVYFIVRLLHLNRISKSNKSMILDNNQNHKNINEENFWEIMEVIFKDKDGIPMRNGAKEYENIGLTSLPNEVSIIDNLLIGGIKGPINKYDSLR
tara:strand:- start:106 stop:978 length:873 start_codon:yes stop_codon:yes gene_type:complete